MTYSLFFSLPDAYQQFADHEPDRQRTADGPERHQKINVFGASRRGPHVDGEKSDLPGAGSRAHIYHVLGHGVLQNDPSVPAEIEKTRQRTSRAGKLLLLAITRHRAFLITVV